MSRLLGGVLLHTQVELPQAPQVCEAYGAKLSQQMTIGRDTGIIVCTIEKANIL